MSLCVTHSHTSGQLDVQDVRQLGAQHVTVHVSSMVGDTLPRLGCGAELLAMQQTVTRRLLSQQSSSVRWLRVRPASTDRTLWTYDGACA